MSGRTEIQNEINKYKRWIDECNEDIKDMEDIQTSGKTYESNFDTEHTTSTAYDLTVSGTWKQDLCDTASEYHTLVSTGIESAKTQTATMDSELGSAIQKAQELIEEYQECIENLQSILDSMD